MGSLNFGSPFFVDGNMKKFVRDLWRNPFFWLSFAIFVAIRLIWR
jgi:hypothetical protein